MDRREKLANKMIKYLESRINCQNVMQFIEKHIEAVYTEGTEMLTRKLLIGDIMVIIEIIKYNDDTDYVKLSDTDPRDRKIIERIYDTYEFMTDANYNGFEYFPYIYGVLDCREGTDSAVYTFYEMFDSDLTDLMKQIHHPSEWYDVFFQMSLINYYFETVKGYTYKNGTPQNHLYKKLKPAIKKEYELDGFKFEIMHSSLIVMWDIDELEKINDKKPVSKNIKELIRYINENRADLSIAPSKKMMQMLEEISNEPSKTPQILNQYYNQ